MGEATRQLKLYEALELRSEYDARIKTLKDCLPETRQNRNAFSLRSEDATNRRPSSGFTVSVAREQLRTLEFKRRKLNTSIQGANFRHHLAYGGASMSLSEALATRKGINDQIGELHTQVVESAYERVIYKEDRDIVETPELPYSECAARLDEARVAFRELNRSIRAASFETAVEYADE